MRKLNVCVVIAVAGIGAATVQVRGTEPGKQPPASPEGQDTRRQDPTPAATDRPGAEREARTLRRESAPRADDTSAKIVVHSGAATSAMSDARVSSGNVRISMPGWQGVDGSSPVVSSPDVAVGADGIRTGGAIMVPNNTRGPGEPYWRMSERADTEKRLADARVKIAEAEAERAARLAGRDRNAIIGWGSFGPGFGYGFGGSFRNGPLGLHGPVTTTTIPADGLGSTAQRHFGEAAYPRLNGSTDARDAAVRQFGRDATPPIVRPQNDIDAAHRDANRERR